MVNEPDLVFLDEPTTGLDPQVRLEIHSLISELKASKCTTLITTHYIEEAERLCDRVAIVDQGQIIAMGTPRDIQAQDARAIADRGAHRVSPCRRKFPRLRMREEFVVG